MSRFNLKSTVVAKNNGSLFKKTFTEIKKKKSLCFIVLILQFFSRRLTRLT